jgi:hypothetical protein
VELQHSGVSAILIVPIKGAIRKRACENNFYLWLLLERPMADITVVAYE